MFKLLTASDGKIPFIPIIIGVLVGALAMFIYAKFYKPKILFNESNLPFPQPRREQMATIAPQQSTPSIPIPTTQPPSFIGMNDIIPNPSTTQMPQLPRGYREQDDYTEDEEDDDENEEEEGDRPRLM